MAQVGSALYLYPQYVPLKITNERQDSDWEEVRPRNRNKEEDPTSATRFVPIHTLLDIYNSTLPRSPIFANTELETWLTIVADSKHILVDRS